MIEKFEIGRWYEFGSKAFEVLDINPEEDRLLVRYHIDHPGGFGIRQSI